MLAFVLGGETSQVDQESALCKVCWPTSNAVPRDPSRAEDTSHLLDPGTVLKRKAYLFRD